MDIGMWQNARYEFQEESPGSGLSCILTNHDPHDPMFPLRLVEEFEFK
jgi:hypothetical protein